MFNLQESILTLKQTLKHQDIELLGFSMKKLIVEFDF